MGGLAAVLADDRTRAGIRDALKQRLCYATNGPRIILRAALNGARMGSTVEPREGKSLLYVRAITCAPVAAIELIRRGEIAQTLEGQGAWDVEAAFEPEDLATGEYVYVRVIQADGGMAWCSPYFAE
jgi:hypothetical protein